jgi:hypothetical protein
METPKTIQDAPRGRGVRRKSFRDKWERALLYRFVLRVLGDSRKEAAKSGDRAGGCRLGYSRQTHQVLDVNPSKKAQGPGEARAESAQLGDRDTLDE